MDIAANGDWGVDSLDVALLDEDFSGLGAEVFDFLLRNGFSLSELGDLFVEKTGHE